MYTINESSVFQKTYILYKFLHIAIKKFPKGDRHAIGERMLNTTLDMLVAIIEAGSAKREWKIPPIDRSLTKLEINKVFVRLAHETQCFTERQYIDLQSCFQEIGRMLGGWRKSV